MTWTDGENLRSTRTLKLFARDWALSRFAAGLTTLATYRLRTFQKSSIAFANTFAKADTTIDAGANLGAVTVYMSLLVGRRGRVIAVEMMPDTAAMLRHNLELNSATNVAVVELALDERAGETVVARLKSGFHGQASIAQRSARSDRDIEVRTTTLQSLMNGIEEVALLKLDLEDAEAQALRGAGDAIGRIRAILFESHVADGGDTARLLREAGFGIAAVDCRNFIARREQTSWPSASIKAEASNESLCLPKSETYL